MKAVNVDDVLQILYKYGPYIFVTDEKRYSSMVDEIANLKPLPQETVTEFADRCRECGKMKRCKDCKFFREADVDGIPLIENRDFCLKWGGKCKTNKDGYCFLFEPEEGSDSDERKTEIEKA